MSMNESNGCTLPDNNGIGLVAGNIPAVQYQYAFVHDNIGKRTVFADITCLHYDRIAYYSPLAYMYAPEQDGVFNFAFDYAAVGDY